MKLILRQKIWLALVLVTNLTLWAIPSDVVELIARDRHTLLGRYSRTHFSWIVVVALISVVSCYVDWSTGAKYKRRWFQVLAGLLVLVPAVGLVDFFLRTDERVHYVRDTPAYHRPGNSTFDFSFEDKPQAARTYPDAPPGYASVSGVCRTDQRGYRNDTDTDEAEIVVLGDSFAEGSSVLDEDAWPVRLAQRLGATVTNLGMSGYSPAHYLESLKAVGLSLKPRTVLCLLYEGNDFRRTRGVQVQRNASFSKRVKTYFKQSPVREALDRLMIRTFGPINSRRALRGAEMIDWLPLAIPQGPSAKYYAFGPEKLRDLYQSHDAFSGDRHWLVVRQRLEEMNALCKAAGCRFVVVFAPTNAHVLLPLVGHQLSAEKVRAFTAIRYKHTLPPPVPFLVNLLAWIEGRETVVADWCDQASIPFISLTKPLRTAAAGGTQVYYTYDQHWSPDGHAVVAGHVAQVLSGEGFADGRGTKGSRDGGIEGRRDRGTEGSRTEPGARATRRHRL